MYNKKREFYFYFLFFLYTIHHNYHHNPRHNSHGDIINNKNFNVYLSRHTFLHISLNMFITPFFFRTITHTFCCITTHPSIHSPSSCLWAARRGSCFSTIFIPTEPFSLQEVGVLACRPPPRRQHQRWWCATCFHCADTLSEGQGPDQHQDKCMVDYPLLQYCPPSRVSPTSRDKPDASALPRALPPERWRARPLPPTLVLT